MPACTALHLPPFPLPPFPRTPLPLYLPHLPAGSSFLILGPSGVGKTELAKALAAILFDSEKMLIR